MRSFRNQRGWRRWPAVVVILFLLLPVSPAHAELSIQEEIRMGRLFYQNIQTT